MVDLPNRKRAIGTKWVYRNKKDERSIVIKNKARLVAQGYTQEQGIDYDEVFAPVTRIEAIRLFLTYASFKDFVVYQMDVKSDFLYGKIEEEVYICQPPGFEDLDFPDRVYKVEKALYELHQAPRAWYETLSTYLLDNGFQRGNIDKTLFIRMDKGDILLVQVQDKYVTEILKKFGFTDVKTASTLMETQKPLLKDEDGEEVDVHLYRSMIGSLMYLTSSRPDIMFAVCACARYQVNLKVSHLHAVKRIFRYLKGQPKLGLWYPKDSPFDLVAYTDSDYAGASLDKNSTIGEAEYVAASSCCGQVLWIQNQLLDYGDSNEKKLIQMIKIHTDKNVADLLTKAFDNGKAAKDEIELMLLGINLLLLGKSNAARHKLTAVDLKLMLLGINLLLLLKVNVARHNLQLLVNVNAVEDRKKIIVTEASIRSDLQLDDDDGIDCLPNAIIFKELTRMGDNLADKDVNEENISEHSNDPLLSSEDRLKLEELMALCTNLQNRVLDLEHTKATQALEIDSLKRRMKVWARRMHSNRRGIHDIDADEDITLENVHDDDMFGVNDLDGDEVFVEIKEPAFHDATTTSTIPVSAAKDLSDVDITLAQALAELKNTKPKVVTPAATTTTTAVIRPKAKGLVIQEQEQVSTPITSSKDKGKRIIVEEPLKMKKKDQALFAKQEAIRLQAQFDEEERLKREKEEANASLISQWNDIQDKVETDYELAQRLQAEEQEELTIEEKSKTFQQLLEKRRKHFVAKRA
ncbi:putative ribonuclease H-like domain-containing protein [Tanacetum coccineum]